jgi:hypothetical protein
VHSNSTRSTSDGQFTAANIANGVNILGVTGTFGGSCSGPSGCVSIGSVCSDGSVFAGCSPSANVPMFATRCDAGQTWGGASCTGTRTTDTHANSITYCNNLSIHSQTDWYLPDRHELDVLYLNRSSILSFITSSGAMFWSSTVYDATYARYHYFETYSAVDIDVKTSSVYRRCVRHD